MEKFRIAQTDSLYVVDNLFTINNAVWSTNTVYGAITPVNTSTNDLGIKKTLSLCLLCVFVLISFLTNAQKYLNKEWSSLTGMPFNLEWNATATTSNNELIVLGNTYRQGQSSNILLTKYNSNGTIEWQREYNNADSTEDYGISLSMDENNIYIAGAFGNVSSNSLDLIILKYDFNGTLHWTYVYDNINKDNIPIKIVSDGDEQLYVTGYNTINNNDWDIFLLKLDDEGSFIWSRTYDYNNLKDFPTGLYILNENSRVILTGISASQTNEYDIILRRYNFDGNIISANRSNGSFNIDNVNSMGMDSNGHIILGGYYTDQYSNIKMTLVKFNDTLGFEWVNYIDHDTLLEGKIAAIKVTPDGMIFITGHVETESDFYKAYVAKVNTNGTVDWEYFYQASEGSAFGKILNIDIDGNLNAGGIYRVGDDTNLLIMQFDTSSGSMLFFQEYDSGDNDYLGDMTSDNLGNIYIQSISSSSSGNVYNSLKYSSFMRDIVPTCDTDSVYYVAHELIICFNEDYVNKEVVNNRGKTFGKLYEFIDETVFDSLDFYFGVENINFRDLNTFKIFKDLTSDDTISISRLGDTVKVPPFWATFVVQLPLSANENILAELLDSFMFPIIRYAELNYLGELCSIPPNDPLYNQFPAYAPMNGINNAHINMENAWNIETGHPDIKVGIYDSGINWAHDDFSIDGLNTLKGSKIKDGWDYTKDCHISNVPAPESDYKYHGTAAASIIGGLSNNLIGVPGIAGGDMSTTPANPGVSLYSLRISGLPYSKGFSIFKTLKTIVPNDKIALAIYEGAQEYSNFVRNGYGLHIQNHSWTSNEEQEIIKKAIQFAYWNSCVIVASSGNEEPLNENFFPASYRNSWVIKVGSSDENGDWAEEFSKYGENMDVISPGLHNLYTCISDDEDNYRNMIYEAFFLKPSWKEADGTSFSAPMVSGLAALLQSHVYRNINNLPNLLAPEDIEYLITQNTRNNPAHNYSDEVGYGLIDAGATLAAIEYPFYKIQHNKASCLIDNNMTLVESDVILELEEDYADIKGKIKYYADVYKISMNINHNIGNYTRLDHWPLNHCSNLFGYYNASNIIDIEPNIQVINVTDNSATVEGYIYHLKTKYSFPFTNLNRTVPSTSIKYAHFAYSLYLHDQNASFEQTNLNNRFSVRPNPSLMVNTIYANYYNNEYTEIDLFDINGKFLKNIYKGKITNSVDINTDVLDKGIYFYKIITNSKVEYLKFLKI